MKLTRIVTALAASSVFSFTSISMAQAEQLKVLSSFTIIGDMVQNVGGEHVAVSNLAGHGVDLHHFEPKPSNIKKFTDDSEVKLLFINGLELEPWIESIKDSSGFKGETIVVSEGVKAIKFADIHGNDHEDEHDDHGDEHTDDHHDHHEHDDAHDQHDHGEWDPHAWQNPLNAVVYVENILKALKVADPDNAKAYEENAANYVTEIKKLNDETKQAFAALPEEKRRFATNHEAFAYLADAYDLTQIPVSGVGGAEPSAAQVAEVIEGLKEHKVGAVFFENTTNNRLIEQVARDTNVKIGGTLVADALEKEGEGSTYLGMVKKNTTTLLEALK